MAHWHHLGFAVGLTVLVGCGSPTPEAPVSGHSTGSTDAVVSPPAGDASRAGIATHEPARQTPTPTSPLGAPAPPGATAAERRSPDAQRATSSAPAASQADPPPSNAQTPADQAQREARELWFAELRESPDVTVRLQALELWAQQPGDGIDPLTYALVDEDEQVRARAEELWEQQLTKEEGFGGQAEW